MQLRMLGKRVLSDNTFAAQFKCRPSTGRVSCNGHGTLSNYSINCSKIPVQTRLAAKMAAKDSRGEKRQDLTNTDQPSKRQCTAEANAQKIDSLEASVSALTAMIQVVVKATGADTSKESTTVPTKDTAPPAGPSTHLQISHSSLSPTLTSSEPLRLASMNCSRPLTSATHDLQAHLRAQPPGASSQRTHQLTHGSAHLGLWPPTRHHQPPLISRTQL